MAQLKILQEPDPRLREPTFAVEKIDAEIVRLLDDMLETMYLSDGIGLAAPQVNLRHRLVVMDLRDADGPMKMVNPEVIWRSDHSAVTKEGCLSVPDYISKVQRCAQVRVRYWDEKGQEQEQLFSGLKATCVQHEIDHLDGILFIDHLSSLEQKLVRKKLQKIQSFSHA